MPGRPDPFTHTVVSGNEGYIDAEADMLSAETSSAICVQRLDDSRNSAIHTTYRISLRSSSLREPRYPLLRVVLVNRAGRPSRLHSLLQICLVWSGWLEKLANPSSPVRVITGLSRLRLERHGTAHRLVAKHACETDVYTFTGVVIDRFNDPSAGSPTETLLRLLLPLGGRV